MHSLNTLSQETTCDKNRKKPRPIRQPPKTETLSFFAKMTLRRDVGASQDRPENETSRSRPHSCAILLLPVQLFKPPKRRVGKVTKIIIKLAKKESKHKQVSRTNISRTLRYKLITFLAN